MVTVVLWGLCVGMATAQQPADPNDNWNSFEKPAKHARSHKTPDHSLNSDERLAVLASALDSKLPRIHEYDCSHLVHAIYERAGFPYAYASSDDLYDGVEGFQRVAEPAPGDIVVWHGHAGIVVRPRSMCSSASCTPARESTTTPIATGVVAANRGFIATSKTVPARDARWRREERNKAATGRPGAS